jgi:LmbE family N-acetylglucosaminyl deacetylase
MRGAYPFPFSTAMLLGALLIVFFSAAPLAYAGESRTLAPDQGAVRWHQTLLEMSTPLRLMCVAAHPDDEDGETLAFYNRGLGVRTSLLLANWGEGGQNEIGPELYEDLGVIRSHETLEAARLAGTQHVYCLDQKDFGFSKTPEETWRFWNQEEALKRMVRILRVERPHVVITNHRLGTGHGNHQAMAQLIAEAIPLAASSEVYQEQMEDEGLSPWRVNRFFQRRRHHEGVAGEVCDVTVPTASMDPVRGLTYQEIAAEALMRHRSQGVKGIWGWINQNRKKSSCTSFTLLAGTPNEKPLRDLFDGLDGAWWTAPPVSGGSGRVVDMEHLDQLILAVRESLLSAHLNRTGGLIQSAIDLLQELPAEIDSGAKWAQVPTEKVLNCDAGRSPEEMERYRVEVIERMQEIGEQQKALEGLLGEMWGAGLTLECSPEALAPGCQGLLTLTCANRGNAALAVNGYELELPQGWRSQRIRAFQAALAPLGQASAEFLIQVPTSEEPTLPARVALYQSSEPWLPNVRAAMYLSKGELAGSVRAAKRIEISPLWTVSISPGVLLVPKGSDTGARWTMEAAYHGAGEATAELAATFPEGRSERFTLSALRGDPVSHRIHWKPGPGMVPGEYSLKVDLMTKGAASSAASKVILVEVTIPESLSIGVIQSYDSTLPDALHQLGIDYRLLSPVDLVEGNLSRFGTILVDIRGYLERSDLRVNNARLLDYVREGGRLVVFYHKSFDWNDADPPYAPYTLHLSGSRVTEENAPVTALKPDHLFFHTPNRITPDDWDGWIQERGLYFPGEHDPIYEEMISMNDSGNEPLRGGILWAKSGKGTYIYTCLSWYRQLRAGVPGAYRLFVNLIAGAE